MVENSGIIARIESLLNIFMHEDPSEIAEMNCRKLARLLNMDEKTLRARFDTRRFASPAAMIKQKKLRLAAVLMADDPDKSIEQIANQAGFQNRQYFSQQFKKQYGIPPSSFKKRLSH